MAKLEMSPEDAYREFGEPCNNCKRWVNGVWCAKGHRQKDAALAKIAADGSCPNGDVYLQRIARAALQQGAQS